MAKTIEFGRKPKIIDEYTYLPLTRNQRKYYRKRAREVGHFVRPRTVAKANKEKNKARMIQDEYTNAFISKEMRHYYRNRDRMALRGGRRIQQMRETDPEKYAEFLAKKKEYNKSYRERKKVEAERQARLEKASKYWKRKVKELNIREDT